MVDIEVSQETTNRLHAILSGLGKADEKVLNPQCKGDYQQGGQLLTSRLRACIM